MRVPFAADFPAEVGRTVALPAFRELLTTEHYAALGVDEALRWSELVEGQIVMSPGRHWSTFERSSGS